MDDLLADFVAETREMLEASEGELIAWEADPSDHARLDTIFRFVHTVKGNCGFFDFPRLERLSHAAEGTLAEIRSGERQADAELVDAVLAIIDRISLLNDMIEAGHDMGDGDVGDAPLIAALEPGWSALAQKSDELCAALNTHTPTGPANAPRSIRLPVDLLDRVMSGVSDMVLARNDLARRLREAEFGSGLDPAVDGSFDRLSTILVDVREAVTRMRMQRIAHLFGALPRLVRDLSAELGKLVVVDIDGHEVELDREMIENIRDPLTHIIRNAIDHGIESPSSRIATGKKAEGLLTISAWQSGNKITVMISDDGSGLNENAIAAKAVANGMLTQNVVDAMSRDDILQLIFEPGLSTKAEAGAVSGRGVGMDVVRSNLERIGGTIKTTSSPGQGTMFALEIPLTLGIIAGLTVGVGDYRFAIPRSYIEEIAHSMSAAGESGELQFSQVGERRFVTFRDRRIPVLRLAEALDLKQHDRTYDPIIVIVRLASGEVFAIEVDAVFDHEDLVVKPLPPAIMETGVYAGTTLLDDGNPILMLDMPSIAQQNNLVDPVRIRSAHNRDDEPADDTANAQATGTPMIVCNSFDDRRIAVRMELLHRIETVGADALDRDSSGDRVVIDGKILPLIGLPPFANGALDLPNDRLRLLHLTDGNATVLYAVKTVLDSATMSNPVSTTPGSGNSGNNNYVEGLALIDGEVATVLDGLTLFRRYGSASVPVRKLSCRLPSGEPWAKGILAPLIKAAGYRVLAATDPDAADVSFTMSGPDDRATNDTDRDEPQIATIRLRASAESPDADNDDTIYRYDRDGVLAALAKAAGGRA